MNLTYMYYVCILGSVDPGGARFGNFINYYQVKNIISGNWQCFSKEKGITTLQIYQY